MSTAAVEFGSQKKVCKQCWELIFLCTYDFNTDLIFIAVFFISCYAAVTVQNSTKINTVRSCSHHTLLSLHILHLYYIGTF